jgi:phage FluMu gp28-like protein
MSAQALPPLHELDAAAPDDAPPPVLMSYQQAWVADDAVLKICEKSRRTGFTWAEAADDVIIASQEGGSNVFYISATQDMAREYIEACALWARAYNLAASEYGEGLYDDGDDAQGNRKYIKTFEINFPRTGRRIVALSSRPTNLRGKQGVVVIDEAAFAPDLAELLKAAMAMLLWGDRVRIISTHNGMENPFNQLIEEVRAGKRGNATVHRVTFADAVAAGLYKRVCLRKRKDWAQEEQDAWVKAAYAFYGDGAAEELDVIPNASTGAYLPLTLITSRMSPDTPVIRGKWDPEFGNLPADVRRYAVEGWIKENLTPILDQLHKDRKHSFGQDFGRIRDLTCFVVSERGLDLVERVKFQLELSNCPFAQQQQILWHIIDRLPRFMGGAMDAGGNGAMLAELTAQRYGIGMVEQVKLSEQFYLAHMPKLKAALQDGTLVDIPRDDETRDDLRALRLINGIPKLPPAPTQKAAEDGPKRQRHGDAAIAYFMLIYNSHRSVGEIEWMSVASKGRGDSGRSGRADRDDDFADFGGKSRDW